MVPGGEHITNSNRTLAAEPEALFHGRPLLRPYQDKYVLVVTSTTGQGDLPDSIVPLFQGIKDSLGFQPNLRYGVIALGDSSYVNFCNGGKQFDALLQEQSAQRVGEMLLIDASENPEPETESNPWVEHWGTLLS